MGRLGLQRDDPQGGGDERRVRHRRGRAEQARVLPLDERRVQIGAGKGGGGDKAGQELDVVAEPHDLNLLECLQQLAAGEFA